MSDVLTGFLALLFAFFFPNLLYLSLGLIFSKTVRFHRFGIRCLAMCMLVSKRFVASRCHQHCETARCGNWTCENYYHAK